MVAGPAVAAAVGLFKVRLALNAFCLSVRLSFSLSHPAPSLYPARTRGGDRGADAPPPHSPGALSWCAAAESEVAIGAGLSGRNRS